MIFIPFVFCLITCVLDKQHSEIVSYLSSYVNSYFYNGSVEKSFILYFNLGVNEVEIGNIAEFIYKLVEHGC